MSDWRTEINEALSAFRAVAELAGAPFRNEEIEVEFLEAPHRPPASLPSGKMAIYGFWGLGSWLKIGMVGSKSQARYTNQHYNKNSAQSTLAASLAGDPRMMSIDAFNADMPGQWIKSSCHRVNILLSAQHGRAMLALLEAFLHLCLRPRYEV